MAPAQELRAIHQRLPSAPVIREPSNAPGHFSGLFSNFLITIDQKTHQADHVQSDSEPSP